MGSVYLKNKPESESFQYAYVEADGGKLVKVSVQNLKNALGIVDHITTTVTLTVDDWVLSEDGTCYVHPIELENISENSKVELRPTAEQIIQLTNDEISIFIANDSGTLSAYALNGHPSVDMTFEIVITETETISSELRTAEYNELAQKWTDQQTVINEFDEYIDSDNNMMRGVKRKMLAITGELAENRIRWNKEYNYHKCTVSGVADDYIKIYVGGGSQQRSIRISTTADAANQYELCRFAEWGFTRSSVYSTSSTTKTITDVCIDNVRYTNLDVLKTTGFEFRYMLLNYEVQIDSSNVATVSLYISPDYISICETFPESLSSSLVTSLISGTYVNPIATHGDNLKVFAMVAKDSNGNITDPGYRLYTERVEQVGNSVIKTFNLRGGF